MAIKKLTPSLLRQIILSEQQKIMNEADPIAAGISDPEKVSAEEVPAGEEGRELAQDIDYIKVLKVQEARLAKQLRKVQKAKKMISERLLNRI